MAHQCVVMTTAIFHSYTDRPPAVDILLKCRGAWGHYFWHANLAIFVFDQFVFRRVGISHAWQQTQSVKWTDETAMLKALKLDGPRGYVRRKEKMKTRRAERSKDSCFDYLKSKKHPIPLFPFSVLRSWKKKTLTPETISSAIFVWFSTHAKGASNSIICKRSRTRVKSYFWVIESEYAVNMRNRPKPPKRLSDQRFSPKVEQQNNH